MTAIIKCLPAFHCIVLCVIVLHFITIVAMSSDSISGMIIRCNCGVNEVCLWCVHGVFVNYTSVSLE